MEDLDLKAVSLLRQKLEEAKLRNPRLSLRAFAQKVGVSSGALSEILAGKRGLTLKTRRRIVERLGLSPLEQRQLIASEFTTSQSAKAHFQLTSDAYHLISDWWHFAILNLIKTLDFRPEVPWIAKRLGLSREIVKESWLRLFRLGYLTKTTTGVVRKYPKLASTTDIPDFSIRRSLIGDLQLIEHAIVDVDVHEREVNAMTLAIRKKDMPRAKEAIRRFQDEFSDLIESDQADDVYRLSIAFYPLTVRSKESK